MKKRGSTAILLSICLVGVCHAAETRIGYTYSEFEPVLVRAERLEILGNRDSRNVYCYRFADNQWQPVPFQVDFRNDNDEYDFRPASPLIEDNEELVFMAHDLGVQAPSTDRFLSRYEHTALRLEDAGNRPGGWLYILIDNEDTLSRSDRRYVQYHADDDSITSAVYRIAFSSETPMLIDTLQWWDEDNRRYGNDMLDTMRLVHTGNFLHTFPFRRTHKDYSSETTGILDGPVRVIRRTENHVRIVWQLRAPAVYIDYIVNAQSIYMDTVLSLPFTPKWFFSDIETWSTLDLNGHNGISLQHKSLNQPLDLQGNRNDAQAISGSEDTNIGILSDQGQLYFTIDMIDDIPIGMYTSINLDETTGNDPGTEPGYPGDVGFMTDNWEQLGSGRHHLLLKAILAKTVSEDDAYAWLNQ